MTGQPHASLKTGAGALSSFLYSRMDGPATVKAAQANACRMSAGPPPQVCVCGAGGWVGEARAVLLRRKLTTPPSPAGPNSQLSRSHLHVSLKYLLYKLILFRFHLESSKLTGFPICSKISFICWCRPVFPGIHTVRSPHFAHLDWWAR